MTNLRSLLEEYAQTLDEAQPYERFRSEREYALEFVEKFVGWVERRTPEPRANLETCPTCGKLGEAPPLEEWQLRALKQRGPRGSAVRP